MNNLQALKDYLTTNAWKFHVEHTKEGREYLTMGMSGKNGEWSMIVDAIDEQNMAVVYAVLPKKVSEEFRVRDKVMEFITRANSGMVLGSFEMDLDDGEVRFKTSISTLDDDLTEDAARNLVYPNVFMMDRYFRGFMAVIFDNISPVDACNKCESTKRPKRVTAGDLGL